MVGVLSSPTLHLAAADGYLKTGMTADLNGKRDHEDVRDAGVLWNELGMRAKMNAAVAEVEEEARNGRLK